MISMGILIQKTFIVCLDVAKVYRKLRLISEIPQGHEFNVKRHGT